MNTKRKPDSLSSGRPHPDTGGKPKVPITENAIRDLNESAQTAQSDPLKPSGTAQKSGAPGTARSSAKSATSAPSTSASTAKASVNASVSGEAKPAAAAAPRAAASAAPAKPVSGASPAGNSKASKKA